MVVQLSKSLSSNFLKVSRSWTLFRRPKSNAHVVMTDDSTTIVCWHPETHFPYEKSLPLPEKPVVKKSDSLLKVQSNKDFLTMLKPKRQEVIIEELTQLTATTKHIWYPKGQQFRRKKAPEPDRPYL